MKQPLDVRTIRCAVAYLRRRIWNQPELKPAARILQTLATETARKRSAAPTQPDAPSVLVLQLG